MKRIEGSALTARATANPSISGICMSRITTSKGVPPKPSRVSQHLHTIGTGGRAGIDGPPARCSSKIIRFVAWSSTIKTRTPRRLCTITLPIISPNKGIAMA